tara:strand:- start:1736 stop:2719 length:984 start_codon:yes stop_codon:yes gene_type:complete
MKDWSVDILKDFWVKLGCFITGYSYTLIRNSSEASRKTVKKFLSAILLIGTIWFAVGYLFVSRYFDANSTVSLLSGVVMVIAVIQIERQIILASNLQWWGALLRFLLGALMAVIGATVIDQVMFKDDVERYKNDNADVVVEKRIAQKMDLYNSRYLEIDEALIKAVQERDALILDVAKRPYIKSYKTKTNTARDTAGEITSTNRQVESFQTENPNIRLLAQKDIQIESYESRKNEIVDKKSSIYNDEREKFLNEPEGFLTELESLYEILRSSSLAKAFYIMWFVLLVLIEMLVLAAKGGDGSTDYERLIQHQSDVNKRSIDSLTNDT